MSNQPQSRSILAKILKNFINSIKPRQWSGDLIGKDYHGTKYFEIPADPSLGRRRERWFEPINKENFEQELPPEWQAWLRGKRREPPTEDEIDRNLALIHMKKINAIEVDKKGGLMTPATKGFESFPKRTEYELTPGKDRNE
ncbi:NADH dehydrogenase [ubiquinone] 1 alpha subcomplex assembly factor 2 [Onthophagus taurus]|uniref:NADH dehydrogenase [ubiquinone] 1 alpha subcomplex assembly factor 2 n=1 Tax=Onthophagus taurus TaxID=166361 RepID=UPI000C200815|nr:NADH dehydrogenase [ubiquinone] 1 alpha subcomplex assembly factor 2 [Onthophagus taurus]